MGTPIVQMDNIHKHYALNTIDVHALRGIDLRIDKGEFISITGPSGSGKSTLMNIIGCLDLPDTGSYLLNGQNILDFNDDGLAHARNKSIGFVFQNFNLLPNTSALENVETPLVYAGIGKSERRMRAQELLERVGLGDRLHHCANQLSGGQQQRVAIARALINQPALLLADEPTGNLDSATSEEIMQILEEINRDQGLSMLLITHDPDVTARTQRILSMNDGLLETTV